MRFYVLSRLLRFRYVVQVGEWQFRRWYSLSTLVFNLVILCCNCTDGSVLKRKDLEVSNRRRINCIAQTPPPAWPGRAVPELARKKWDGPKLISVVGSTGSIGTQTLDIVAENSDKFRIVALAAGSNATLLADQVKTFRPRLVAVRNESLIGELKEALADADYKPEIVAGEDGVVEVAHHPEAVTVVTGIVGCAGLKDNLFGHIQNRGAHM